MWTLSALVLLCICAHVRTDSGNDNKTEDPVLYYYGIEESERSLPRCSGGQACSARVRRYWRAPALVRMCRCARRQRCDAPAPPHSRLHVNNLAYLQFCEPVASWPKCNFNEISLTLKTKYERMNPDDLEKLHHKNLQLIPPQIVIKCRCSEPNYWKINSTTESEIQSFSCASLPPCKSGEYCGNVSDDLYAVYQLCLCPQHHICVHNGGVPRHEISELLYRGKGWRAYCQPTGDFSYEDYYD